MAPSQVQPGYLTPQMGYLPPPGYWVPPQPSPWAPSPGLRIFLMVVLSLAIVPTGLFSLFGVLGVAGGANSPSDILFWSLFIVLLALSILALVGVAIRARWSRVVSIVTGVALSLTCVGLVLGIPILVASLRAPDLTGTPA